MTVNHRVVGSIPAGGAIIAKHHIQRIVVMPSILKINDVSINISGTSFQGDLIASYSKIVEKLGDPMSSFCGYKTDAEWCIEFDNGVVATIYNWKNGVNYLGHDGLPVEDIVEWHIGGSDSRVSAWVSDLIINSWPVFDEIRMSAQF